MARSQNGWPANDRSVIVHASVPGTNSKIHVRRGDVETVLMYVASQFHARVEGIDTSPLDNWGYAERPIRGGTTLSNHASGTAIDLNATRHPLGARGTFTQKQVIEIERILKEVSGVVRWGGHYLGRKDEMHFEIVGNANQVKTVAAKLRSTTTPVEDDVFAIRYGDSGDYVKRAQKVMNAAAKMAPRVNLDKLVEDGEYGPKTRDAVNAFAKSGKMPQEGDKGMHVLVLDYCRNWLDT